MTRPKLYTCKVCKKRYEKGDLHKHNPLLSACSIDCVVALANKQMEKKKEQALKEKRKEWQEKKKVWRAELHAGKQTQDPLQKEINKLVRLLDADLPCLARPSEQSQYFDAGHIFSVGSYPSLRYHLWNIHKQSVKSNKELGGESLRMLDGLESRYGSEIREYVESLKKEYPILKLTPDEKDAALKKVRELIRRINKGEMLSRDYCQNFIEIYK